MSNTGRLPCLGAYERWKKELYGGSRGDPNRASTWLMDDLWLAAGREYRARELWQDGLHDAARRVLAEAAESLYKYDPTSGPKEPATPFADVPARAAPNWGTG